MFICNDNKYSKWFPQSILDSQYKGLHIIQYIYYLDDIDECNSCIVYLINRVLIWKNIRVNYVISMHDTILSWMYSNLYIYLMMLDIYTCFMPAIIVINNLRNALIQYAFSSLCADKATLCKGR